MNKQEAFKRMVNDEIKIGHPEFNGNWDAGDYIYFNPDHLAVYTSDGDDGIDYLNAGQKDGFFIYTEPKPKKEKWILWQKDCGKKKPKEGTYKELQFMAAERYWDNCNGSPMEEDCVYRYHKT